MGLFKEKKKAHIKAVSSGGAEISPERPRYVEKTPPCIGNCPAGADIRSWLVTIAQHEASGLTSEQAFQVAWETITDRNPFPAVCGRVCPHPCEDNCNRKEKDGGVAVNALERFIGDFGIEKGLKLSKLTDEEQSEKIAVIGAGPAGMSCAYHLARRGYKVTVFESFDKPGGMLRYGIPKYRLPRRMLDAEIQNILDLGVELKTNFTIGKDMSMEDLRKEYQAVFVGIGAHKGYELRVPGEDASNVFTGTEYLNRVNSGQEVEIGGQVVVIGGGDTAIDAARVSKRLGADVTILYRRTRKEMPAIDPEIVGAEEEGVNIEYLAAPLEILRSNGTATGLKCIRMELGEPDASGRRRPVPVQGSEFEMPATSIIAAISQEPKFDGFLDLKEEKDWIKINEFGETKMEGVFAGGDDTNLGLVSIAIGQGRFAAEAIDARFRGKELTKPQLPPPITADKVKLDWYKPAERHERTHVPPQERGMDTEVERGLTETEVLEESQRCMSCGMCMDCETCWMYCTNNAFVRLPKGEHYKVKLELCNGCKKCADACPCGFIEMQ
jgi:NADPH-dependent glutamate synthase beta subunit-like oxidoreductase/Pyruvate/2-oxoacid:ferredoxin oxidoreductase delta subunit